MLLSIQVYRQEAERIHADLCISAICLFYLRSLPLACFVGLDCTDSALRCVLTNCLLLTAFVRVTLL
jgi:hypothetical protein